MDAEDENLSTPLMLASLGGHPHCVHELVLAGADVTRRNINDVRHWQTSWIMIILSSIFQDTAYSLAVKHGARNVQTVLENHMLSIISGQKGL